jgi:predicted nucleic acid-binding protein
MAPVEPFLVVVCDAGPLIHLDELSCLDLLCRFTEIYVPEAVWQEVQRHRPSALRRRRVQLSRIDLVPEATPELVALIRTFSLGAGEEEALRLMQQFPDAILLTDDGAARLLAQQMGFAVRGTIGVVLHGLTQGLKSRRQVLNLLKAIPRRSTLHIAPSLLHSIIAKVQEGAP